MSKSDIEEHHIPLTQLDTSTKEYPNSWEMINKQWLCSCGSKEFRVFSGSYLTCIQCVNCNAGKTVHEG